MKSLDPRSRAVMSTEPDPPVEFGIATAPVVQPPEPLLHKDSPPPPSSGDLVTCPECGEMALVETAQRRSADFCRRCDFPLFWARTTVIVPSGEETGASLRRLPGTVGRAATAALICPHCAEPNAPTAQICVRCALSLHPVDIPEPEPAPPPLIMFEPPPEPAAEPAPAPGFDWWWIVAVVMAVIAITLIILLIVLQ